MSRNAWLVFVAVCVVLLGGLVWVSQGAKIDVSNVNTFSVLAGEERNGNIADHVHGKSDSKVIIYEYGDYQCPGCKAAFPTLKTVYEKYQDKVGFVFRNFPLSSIHANARSAASAAEAAGLQNKYWEMHDLLYTNQSAWESLSGTNRVDTFKQYASQLGLDQDKFVNDMNSDAVSKKITFDMALGQKNNVNETPTVYINSDKVSSYFKDDELVSSTTSGASSVLNDATAFENLILIPAMKKAGISLD